MTAWGDLGRNILLLILPYFRATVEVKKKHLPSPHGVCGERRWYGAQCFGSSLPAYCAGVLYASGTCVTHQATSLFITQTVYGH